jgi:hypothetical protein
MSAVRNLVSRHWKRLLFAVFGTAVASGSVAYARKRVHDVPPVAELPVDTGPIVSERSITQRIRAALPKRRPKGSGASGGGGGMSSAANTSTKTSSRSSQRDEGIKPRTPIPQRTQESREIAEAARQARAAAREAARNDLDGPEFGPEFGPKGRR